LETKKRKHHYVWEYYLGAWAVDGQIWCRRGEKCFRVSTENVAHRRDFYRLKEMSDNDVVMVERLISRMGEHARESARGWVPYFRAFHLIRRDWEASGRINPDFETKLDVAINNMEEEWHASIEGRGAPILAALLRGDLATLENNDVFADFAIFIATQYMRTPVRTRRTIEAFADLVPNFNVDAAWGLLRTIFAGNIGAALYVQRKSMRITLLEARGAQFITGDQPIVNTRAAASADCVPPSELELYYPVSPELALLMDWGDGSGVKERRMLPAAEVGAYNRLLSRASGEQIYARTEEALRIVPVGSAQT
jgi:hypothetical protein